MKKKVNDLHIHIDNFFTINDLHNLYHKFIRQCSKDLNIKFYLLDTVSSPNLHYISLDRTKTVDLIKYLITNKYHFSIKSQPLKEVFYNNNFVLDDLKIEDINTLKIYKKYYYKVNNYLLFGYREAIIIDFWREENGLYLSNIYSKYGRIMDKNLLQTNITSININNLDIPCLSICKESYENFLKNPIDVVYTWVDSNDKEWLKKKDAVLKKEELSHYHETAIDKARFTNNNELNYSLRSVFTYLKGINNVYIVTDKQIPSFLNKNKRIKIIDHTKIFKDKTKLPSFNSNAIGSQLHHIRGLAKRYLYFNDDIFVTRGNTMNLFFDNYNKAKCFFSTHVSILPTKNSEKYTPVDNAAINNREALEKEYNMKVYKKFQHTPVPVLKEEMQFIEKKFKHIFDITTSNPIRSNTDYSIAGAFYYHHGLIRGKIAPSKMKYLYTDLGEENVKNKLLKILANKESSRYDIVCINSTMFDEKYLDNALEFQSIFNKCFPYKGFWEK